MAVKAIIPSGWGEITVHGLHQWDYGQTLEIQSVDIGTKVAEIHFACKSMTEAIVRPCSFTNGVGSVAIPDRCLEQTFPITAWVYEVGESSGVTVKTITLPIIERTRPQLGEEHIPEAVSNRYAEAIEEMNELLEKQATGEIVARKAITAEEAQVAWVAQSVVEEYKVKLADTADKAFTAGEATYAYSAGTAKGLSKPEVVFEGDGSDIVAGFDIENNAANGIFLVVFKPVDLYGNEYSQLATSIVRVNTWDGTNKCYGTGYNEWLRSGTSDDWCHCSYLAISEYLADVNRRRIMVRGQYYRPLDGSVTINDCKILRIYRLVKLDKINR